MKRPCHAASTALSIAALLYFSMPALGDTPTQKLILDADTANEIDDLYAIIRLLKQDKFDVIGLNSAQWRHYLGEQDSVQSSQKLNRELVALLNRTDIPTLLGSEDPMGKPWGEDTPKDSPAAQFIIKSAREMPADEKLIVVCIGASTNLASAIKLAPEIAPKIKAYAMGFKFNAERQVWNKSEFNVRRDLNAADFLLNTPMLELHIMSATVSKSLTFSQEASFDQQSRMGQLGQFLTDRWTARFPTSKNWIMWDVALVEALIHPELATEQLVSTPPENRQRKVWMYTSIETDKMRDDFWQAALAQ